MEYHFTGTGGSPDFTFIADGIIDGTGKVIPYSAVKSTKVKRKGHESILTLETKENGTKTEYCYSVDSKDDKDLRRAVIDIESIWCIGYYNLCCHLLQQLFYYRNWCDSK